MKSILFYSPNINLIFKLFRTAWQLHKTSLKVCTATAALEQQNGNGQNSRQ